MLPVALVPIARVPIALAAICSVAVACFTIVASAGYAVAACFAAIVATVIIGTGAASAATASTRTWGSSMTVVAVVAFPFITSPVITRLLVTLSSCLVIVKVFASGRFVAVIAIASIVSALRGSGVVVVLSRPAPRTTAARSRGAWAARFVVPFVGGRRVTRFRFAGLVVVPIPILAVTITAIPIPVVPITPIVPITAIPTSAVPVCVASGFFVCFFGVVATVLREGRLRATALRSRWLLRFRA